MGNRWKKIKSTGRKVARHKQTKQVYRKAVGKITRRPTPTTTKAAHKMLAKQAFREGVKAAATVAAALRK